LSPVSLASPLSPSDWSKNNFGIKSKIRPSKTLEDAFDSSIRKGYGLDLDLKKFELVSMKLEKLLDDVHAKYDFDKNYWNSLSPRDRIAPWPGFNNRKRLELVKNREPAERESENTGKTEGDSAIFKKPLNKLAIRSNVFKHTTKWISESAR